MDACPSSAEALEAAASLARVEPRARLGGIFRREMERGWGGPLRGCAARLRIDPGEPFPAKPRPSSLLGILAESASGREFARKARDSCPEVLPDELVLSPYPFGRSVHAFEIEGLGDEEFAKAKAIAVEQVAATRKAGEERPPEPRAVQLPGWGVEVAPAGEDVLAGKLALQGILVLRELPGGPEVGLRAGDLILDYTSLGDADLGRQGYGLWRSTTLSVLEERSRSGGTGGPLRIIRSSKVLSISRDSAAEDVPFDDAVYLLESGGHIWMQRPLVHLGMVGVNAMAPRYRLGPEPARTLSPLVTRVSRPLPEGRTPFSPYAFELPPTEGPIAMVRIKGQARLVDVAWTSSLRTYEIVSARVVSVEFLTPEWLRAFETLDGALQDGAAEGPETAGEEKRASLADAIGRGAAALEAMLSARETEDLRRAALRVEPRARIAHSFGRGIAREWGSALAARARALGVKPSPPIPSEEERCPILEILIESPSPGEFLGRLRERCGEDALDEWLSYEAKQGSARWVRRLGAWEVEGAPPDLFEKLKEHARKSIEDRRAWESKRKPAEAKPPPG